MRLFTLMHDTQYCEAIAWQNVAYNQPSHPSFFLDNGMTMPPPSIYTVAAKPLPTGEFNGDRQVRPVDLAVWRATFGMSNAATPVPGDGNDDGAVDGADFLLCVSIHSCTLASMAVVTLA